MLVSLRIGHDVAPHAFARRSRLQIGVGAKRKVQHSLSRELMGAKLYGCPVRLTRSAAVSAASFSSRARSALKFSASNEICRAPRFRGEAPSPPHVRAPQQLPSALRQQAGIGSGQLYVDLPRFKPCRIGSSRAGGDPEFERDPPRRMSIFRKSAIF